MKNKLTIFCLAFNMLLIIHLSSCSEETPGCTDSSSKNYDATAVVDDGSCQYLRDDYTGIFSGTMDASNDIFDDTSFEIIFSKNATENDKVNLSFPCCPKVKFSGTVVEGLIRVNDQVAVEDFPGCDGTSPFNGTRFNGFVEWQVDFIFNEDGDCITSSNFRERYLNDQQNAICVTTYEAKFSRG